MKKITLLSITLLVINQLHSQALYNRVWGKVNWGPGRVFEIKPSTEEIFTDYGLYGYIYSYDKNNFTESVFYKFPHPTPPSQQHLIRLENIKFDNNEDLIVYGRTHNANLATPGVYSQVPITTVFTGYSFIAKISRSGQLLWLTYFHDLAQNTSTVTIDKNNNIYVVNKRNKNDVLSSNSFQNTGDLSSIITYQDVISKLDSNGKHVWSTFYSNGDSRIKNLIAGDNGLYVYGDDFGGTSSNNYFGTSGSYQEYSSGLSSNGNSSNVFITKFNFNGSRIWSTYFGEQISKCPLNYTGFPNNMTVIGDDVFVLTDLKNISTPFKNVATNGAYLTTPISTFTNTTLTKFTSDGKRSFTTYLHGGETLQKTKSNDLLITTDIANTYPNLSSLTTTNAHQKQHGSKTDVYKYILSNNGTTLKYGSFYGFDGDDIGVTIPTINGYYTFGISTANSAALTQFDTNGGLFSGSASAGYSGSFISYFTTKGLSNTTFDKLDVSVYPNPTTNVLNIQFNDILPEKTLFTIYNVTGKKVLTEKAQPTEINQINVSNLSAGVYILQIDNNDSSLVVVKFIKK